MMKHKQIIAATVPALLACVHLATQAQAIPIVSLGTPYAQVRAALQKEGWTPVRQTPEPHDYMGAELRKRGWNEVEVCAGTGRAPCVFVWQNRQGKRLEVVTTGEEPKFGGFR
jgi:hypothetical protein